MKQREKTMALVLIGLMTIVLGGLLYFQYYSREVRALSNKLRTLDDDNFKEEMNLMSIAKAMPRLNQAKKLSLPDDVELSKREYNRLLVKLLRECNFSPTITFKQTELRATTSTAKRPPFTKLNFDVRATGELQELVEFLEKFYRTPLLHHIRSMTVTRPQTGSNEKLDILISIEALILEGAEKRKTLIAEDLKEADLPKRLARTASQYAMIGGNNVFFGPYTQKQGSEPIKSDPLRDPSFLAAVSLNSISNDDEKGTRAEIYDHYNRVSYLIRKRPSATSYRVDSYEMEGAERVRDDVGEDFLIIRDGRRKDKDRTRLEYHRFKVLRVDVGDVFLEEEGKVYRLHIGSFLSQIEKLNDADVKQYKLPVKEKKDDKKEPEKKGSAKSESASATKPSPPNQVDVKDSAKKEVAKELAEPSEKKSAEK